METEKPKDSATASLRACSDCGFIQRMPPQQSGYVTCCVRCDSKFKSPKDYSRMRAKVASFATGALLLFPAAVSLPIIQIEQFGHLHRSSLVGGILELLKNGEWGIAFIVFFFSLVFPILKLAALLELCWIRWLPESRRHHLHKWAETFGKWSMLDVLLLALMVMWIKLSDLVSFQFGPAVMAFAVCVGLSMMASLSFDSQSIWDQDDLSVGDS